MWSWSVIAAIKRVLESRDSNEFSRQELIDRELATIVKETGTTGNTPEQTLSLTLYRLGQRKQIKPLGPGKYRLIKK